MTKKSHTFTGQGSSKATTENFPAKGICEKCIELRLRYYITVEPENEENRGEESSKFITQCMFIFSLFTDW